MEGLVNGPNRAFWKGRRVFVTGHTGFKGGWLSLWLSHLGAHVRGYAHNPATQPNLFTTARVAEHLEDIRGDLNDYPALLHALRDFLRARKLLVSACQRAYVPGSTCSSLYGVISDWQKSCAVGTSPAQPHTTSGRTQLMHGPCDV